jgi:hypothetical protein
MKHLAVLALLLPLAACGAAQHPVEVKGADSDVVALAGTWVGSYTAMEDGRSGSLQFSLELGRHTADGDILLDDKTPVPIQFVAIEKDQVTGHVAPYVDPTCDCQVQTQFEGEIAGDMISGTFTTTVIGADAARHGEWSMMRQ